MPATALRTLSETLDNTPCVFQGNWLNLLFVEDVQSVAPRALVSSLAAPSLVDERRLVLDAQPPGHRFPAFSVTSRPDPTALSKRLFGSFDQARHLLQTQSGLSKHISDQVAKTGPDVVAFVVVDGLSYYDLREGQCDPCLVEGPTITQNGFRQAIGRPSLGQRLFELGYRHQHAFTYFDRGSNALSSDLHRIFGATQVTTVRTFEEVLASSAIKSAASYIQVTMPGLDALSHSHRDQPPVGSYIGLILERFEQLAEALATQRRRVLAVLTADHGLLWRDAIGTPKYVGSSTTYSDSNHPRYLLGTAVRNYTRVVRLQDRTYSLLGFPYLTRRLRSNEWGVHGGISAWESLVPLISHHL